jgi:hypothetical protein
MSDERNVFVRQRCYASIFESLSMTSLAASSALNPSASRTVGVNMSYSARNNALNAAVEKIAARVASQEMPDREGRFAVYHLTLEYFADDDVAVSLTEREQDLLLACIVGGSPKRTVWTWDQLASGQASNLSRLIVTALKRFRIDQLRKRATSEELLDPSDTKWHRNGAVHKTFVSSESAEADAWAAFEHVEARAASDASKPRSCFGRFAAFCAFHDFPSVTPVLRGSEDKAASASLSVRYPSIDTSGAARMAVVEFISGDLDFGSFRTMWPQYKHLSEEMAVRAFGRIMTANGFEHLHDISLTVARNLTHSPLRAIAAKKATEARNCAERRQPDKLKLGSYVASVTEKQATKARRHAPKIESCVAGWLDGSMSEEQAAEIFPQFWWLPSSDFEAALSRLDRRTFLASLSSAERMTSGARVSPADIEKSAVAEAEAAHAEWVEGECFLDLDRLRDAYLFNFERKKKKAA